MAKPGKIGMLDLRNQFIFYASYHNQWVNIAIHLLCIWNIAWSMIFLIQYYTPTLMPAPAFLPAHLTVNAGSVLALFYCFIHIIMEPFAGFLSALLMLGIAHVTSLWIATDAIVLGMPALKLAWIVFASAWILQFIGHGVFEGRAPALLDSWDQAFITAPLFVLLEVLFFFGYRKQFYKECMVEVEKNIKVFQEAKKK